MNNLGKCQWIGCDKQVGKYKYCSEHGKKNQEFEEYDYMYGHDTD